MFFTSNSNDDLHLFQNFESIGLKQQISDNKKALIKINLARAYTKNHPRTDMALLKKLVNYIYQNGGTCAITEGACGYLTQNLVASGLGDALEHYKVKVIDVDLEDYDEVLSYGEHHYIPKRFKDYPVRIAIPASSKREEMLYSSNVKLFVGAVPRKMYQLNDIINTIGAPRMRLHQNLDVSVTNLFLAMEKYSKFHFYINGGLAYNENKGEFILPETYVGNDALELDNHMYKTFFNDCEYPEYLKILESRLPADKP